MYEGRPVAIGFAAENLAAFLAVGLLIATSERGHASTGSPVIGLGADTLHLVGATAWSAGLFSLLFLVRPGVRRLAEPDRADAWAAAVQRFSTVGLPAAALVLLGGTIESFQRIHGWG